MVHPLSRHPSVSVTTFQTKTLSFLYVAVLPVTVTAIVTVLGTEYQVLRHACDLAAHKSMCMSVYSVCHMFSCALSNLLFLRRMRAPGNRL